MTEPARGAEPAMPARVLVVDDIEDNRDLLTRRLQRKGFEAAAAEDGPTALALLDEREFDVVILDWMMPGMSGWEVCRAIREDESLKTTAVLMLTGIGERLNEMTSPLYGADDFLDKPFDLEQLDGKLDEVLAAKASE